MQTAACMQSVESDYADAFCVLFPVQSSKPQNLFMLFKVHHLQDDQTKSDLSCSTQDATLQFNFTTFISMLSSEKTDASYLGSYPG